MDFHTTKYLFVILLFCYLYLGGDGIVNSKLSSGKITPDQADNFRKFRRVLPLLILCFATVLVLDWRNRHSAPRSPQAPPAATSVSTPAAK